MTTSAGVQRDLSELVLDLDGLPIRIGSTIEGLLTAINKTMSSAPPEVQEKMRAALMEVADAPLTLGRAASGALIAVLPEDRSTEAERMDRLLLAMKLHAGGTVEITPQERDLVKRCVWKRYPGALIAPRVCMLIERAP